MKFREPNTNRRLEDTDPFPFGKYKGEAMQDVPASYYHYLWTHGMSDDKQSNVADYIRRSLDALKMENPDLLWSVRRRDDWEEGWQ